MMACCEDAQSSSRESPSATCSGLQPNSATYATLISAQAKAERQACDVPERMQSETAFLVILVASDDAVSLNRQWHRSLADTDMLRCEGTEGGPRWQAQQLLRALELFRLQGKPPGLEANPSGHSVAVKICSCAASAEAV